MMKSIEEILSCPIFFERNRVFRVYEGGKLFADFFGDEPEDGNFPEEWVASCVAAFNKDGGENDGLSIVEGTGKTFKDLSCRHKQLVFGPAGEFALLVKMLDSSIRLPVQAHPDREFSEKFFNSKYGKTEMWLIVDTRENAGVFFGFKEKITKEKFSEAVERSLTDKDVFEPLLNYVPVKPGDVFLINAKAVHAIGPGCLILEVQEPTDFTIQPEYWCGSYRLNDAEMYMGIDKDDALECFDLNVYGDEAVTKAKIIPKVFELSEDGFLSEQLIGYDDTPCFSVTRISLSGEGKSALLKLCPSVCVITKGSGVIKGIGGGCEYERKISKGDYFFMPFAAKDRFELVSDGETEIICACAPEA